MSWEWGSDSGWVPYDYQVSMALNQAKSQNLPHFTIILNGGTYILDLVSMVQYPANNANIRRQIRQAPAATPLGQPPLQGIVNAPAYGQPPQPIQLNPVG